MNNKAAIIIVTYNNLEYTRLALESVLTKTRYPNYEVVVVDNGSNPEMQRWLADYAAKHASVRLILNDRNLGFPAANNVGIRAATESDYIVLLNNDCIVTPGWLSRLIHYLQDPLIGMVGPVTNYAGNEACINPPYYRLEDIDRFARRYAITHHNRSFDIPMLAMFCVALRRAVVDEIGPLDEQFGAGMFEDDDYSLRLQWKGYRTVCAEDVYVHHFGRSSFSKLADDTYQRMVDENRARFEAKWNTVWIPPRSRPYVFAQTWAEHVAFGQQSDHLSSEVSRDGNKRAGSRFSRTLGMLLQALTGAYHKAVPYRERIRFWRWRQGKAAKLRPLLRSLDPRLVRLWRRELRAILAQYPDAKGVVIFPPSIPWYTGLVVRSQQVALGFAELGYIVLYRVNDLCNDDGSVVFQEVAERVHLCTVPRAVFTLCHQPLFVSYRDAYNWALWFQSETRVYEMADHLDVFANFPRRMQLSRHTGLLRQTTAVVSSADDLLNYKSLHRNRVTLAPNSMDFETFADSREASDRVPDDMRTIVASGNPVIGYFGALGEWFDFDLFKRSAEAMPHCEFVLIGPDFDGLTICKSGIESYPNIHWLGPKKYAELPRYLGNFDVATLPLKVSNINNAISPTRLLEYMACELPIVSTNLAECHKYPVVLTTSDEAEWVERLREAIALRHDPAYLAQLRQTVQSNSWQARAQAIIRSLEML